MALVLKDRVKETTVTTGTGTVTLAGAVAGFQSFSAVGDGNQTFYAIVDAATGDWEVGVGTYTVSGTTLSRTTVVSSSNAGSLVPFAAGIKDVFVTYPSSRAVYLDAAGSAVTTLDIGTLGTSTANITTANITSGTITTAPTSNTDIVNKQYADAIASGIHFHEAVAYATTAALPAATYNNGTGGVGATLTGNVNGALTVDSYTFTSPADNGERILVKNQANGAENGVYTLTQAGNSSPGAPFILTRATDFDSVGTGVDQIDEGDFFLVTSGTANVNTAWVQQTPPPITIGTTAIVFQQFSAPITYTAGTGLSESPTYTFNIANIGTAGTYGSASSVPVITTNAQGQVTGVTPTAIAISGAAVSGNISGSAGSVANALTIDGFLTGGSYNGSAPVTIAVDATSANTANKVVARDASGNFSAGTITATLSGSSTSATTATNLAGGAANQIPFQTGASTTGFATAPSASGDLLNWNGSAFAWTQTPSITGLTLSGGTVNGVAYLDASKTVTTGSALTFDGTDLLNTGAYTAPNNGAGAGQVVRIRGASGTGQAGTSGGNGFIQLIGAGGTDPWTSFAGGAGGRRRGGINLQAGTAQADAGGTYVNGSTIEVRGSNATNNGTLTGIGSSFIVTSGAATRPDTTGSGGVTLLLNGGTATSGGLASINTGIFTSLSGSNNGASIVASGANSTASGSVTLTGGGANISGATGGAVNLTAGNSTGVAGANVVITSGQGTANGKISMVVGALGEVVQVGPTGAIGLSGANYGTTGQALLSQGSGSAPVWGAVPVSGGGTGVDTLAANNVILGNGTSAVQTVAPGTSGNVLTSNGTTWTSAAAAGGGPVTRNFLSQATNITLTSSDAPGLIEVTGTKDLTITMPAANTLGTSNYFTIKNSSTLYALVVLDSTGAQLFALQPMAGVFLWAYDTTSAAGLWATREDVADAVGAPVQLFNIGSGSLTPSNKSVSAISATQAVSVYVTNLTVFAVVVTNTAGVITYGQPAFIGRVTASQYASVEMLTSTLGVVFFTQPTTAVAFSVSGTTITPGSPVNVSGSANPLVSLCATSSTTVLVAYIVSTNLRTRLLTLSGTTITLGVESATITSSTAAPIGLTALNNTNALIMYRGPANTETRVLTTSGSGGAATVSLGAIATVATGVGVGISVAAINASTAAAFYASSTGTTVANSLSISGTTVSVGAQTVIDSSTSTNSQALFAVSANTVIAYYARSSTLVSRILTVGGTVTSGAETTLNTLGPRGLSVCALQSPTVGGGSATTALTAYQVGSTFNQLASISGTTVTLGSPTTIQGTGTTAFEGNPQTVCAISATRTVFVSVESIGSALGSNSALYAYLLDENGAILNRILVSASVVTGDQVVSVCAISGTQAVIFSRNNSNAFHCVITVSGSTLIANTPASFASGYTFFSTARISNTQAVVFCRNASSQFIAFVATVSGTGAGATIALGLEQTTSATGTPLATNVVALSSTVVIANTVISGSGLSFFEFLTISGTTVSFRSFVSTTVVGTRAVMAALSPTRVLFSSCGTSTSVATYPSYTFTVDLINEFLVINSFARGYSVGFGTSVALVPFNSSKAMLYSNNANTLRLLPLEVSSGGDVSFNTPVVFDIASALLTACGLQSPYSGTPSSTSAAIVYGSVGAFPKTNTFNYCNYYTASPLLK